MRTVLAIIGARPQFIKHAPLLRQLKRFCQVKTLHTGQHYDDNMSRAFFEELRMPAPDFRLDTGGGRTTAEQTGLMMTGIEQACASVRPDAVLLYGDTNSTLAGALVAAKMCIPSIHVEAGIRSRNRAMPEEVNRIIADTFASILFCPVPEAVENLRQEGISHSGVHLCGDVMCDMLELVRPGLRQMVEEPYYFATIHRPYNTDDPARMDRLLGTLDNLRHPVIFPLHPRTISRLRAANTRLAAYPNIRFTDPVGYVECLSYQHGAECIITDSGGIQKESYMLRKKCITVRSETEWNDTLRHGWNTLIYNEIEEIGRHVHIAPGQHQPGMFGDGRAAAYMAEVIAASLR